MAATIPEKDWGNVCQSVLLPKDLKDKDSSSVKFFSGSGFKLPDASHRNFGFLPISGDWVEVRRYLSTANLTLNFLVGCDGEKYRNIRSVKLYTVFTIF